MSPLTRRLLINLALVLLVSLLLILIWQPFDRSAAANIRLSSLTKSQIEQMQIKVPNRPLVVLQRSQQSDAVGEAIWQITAPMQITASPFRVNNLLNLPNSDATTYYPVESVNLTELGLNPPLAELILHEQVFLFGITDPIQRKRYVLTNNTVFLLSDTVLPILTANIGSLVNTQLLPETAEPIRFTLPDGQIIQQTATGGWEIIPDNPALAADDLQNWVDRWRYSQAIYVAYVTDAETSDLPMLQIELSNNQIINYQLLRTEDTTALYLMDKRLRYLLAESVFTALTTLTVR